ncbi:hypothetical protein [Neisseria sp. Ec49-e6-T10]|uniref:hypothetical protein n=1 Tax=Neisseria sp. Ec49-e6-T10 TaxID=3140744 RepID=UPI003EBA0BEF
MERPKLEIDLEILQQQRQLREQEEQQRIAQKLPEATEEVQQKLQQDNPLKDYPLEHQKQLTNALAVEVARSPTGQKIEGKITISNGSLLAHLDKGLPVHIDIQKVLAQHESELPEGKQKNINPERQKQINEQLALFKIDEQLAKFSPKQQELLKEIMVQLIHEHAGDPPKLNLIRNLENKDELQLITANNKNLSFHPQQYLEQFKDQLQAERPPLSDERQKQINHLMQTHGVDMQFEQKFDQKHFNTLYGAIGYSIQNHTGTPPLVNDIRVDEKQINIELADGYQLKIDTQAVLNGEVDLENCAQRERLPVIAQRGETGESLGRKLDPENPKAAYGYLLATEQIKLIRGDDGHAIPNIRPDKAYHYDPNQYDQAQKQDLSKVAGLAIAKESQFNQALDQARAELAAQKKQEEQLKVQQQTEQANLNKGQMSEDPYYQQMRKEQKFDPFSYAQKNRPKNTQEVIIATLGLMTPKFSPSSSPYSHRSPIQGGSNLLDKANHLKNDVLQNYTHLENKLAQVLKVDANDHSWLAYGKRYAASQIGANKGAALWAEETVTGTVSLAVGAAKTVGATKVESLNALSFGLLSKVAPNLVEKSRAHNAEVAQTTLNIGKTVLNYSKDATLDNLNKYSFGTLGKNFESVNQASQRQQERAEQIYNWGTNQLKEGKQAYLTGDFNTQAKQVKVGIDVLTVFAPMTKGSLVSKGMKAADGLADISKLETATAKLTQNALKTGEISELKYIKNADNTLDLSLKMKVEQKGVFGPQPQPHKPTQVTPKMSIQPLEQQGTQLSKLKSSEQTLAQITKDALEKGEISLQSGKELELGMKLKYGERDISKAVHVEKKINEVENIVKVPDGVPLTQKQVDEIVAIPKGQRPDPSEYLPKEYIDQHLELFKDGAGRIQLQESYNNWGITQRDGTSFVLPKSESEALKNLSSREMEIYLGLPEGQLSPKLFSQTQVLQIDIPPQKSLNVRVPSGNEAGANSQWIPGGKLPTGGNEAIIDATGLVENKDYFINVIKFKE